MTSVLRLEFDPAATITEPLDLAVVKGFCNLRNNDEDDLVTRLMKAARLHIERNTGVILSSRTLIGVCDEWPGCGSLGPPPPASSRIGSTGDSSLEFPVRPVTAIGSISLVDTGGASSTFAASNYYLDKSGAVQRALPSSSFSLTTILRATAGIRVTFTAGYATCPDDLATALQQLVKHWYQNREPTRQGKGVNDIPMTVQRILQTNRLMRL